MTAPDPDAAIGTPFFAGLAEVARIRSATRWHDPQAVIDQRLADLADITTP